MLSSLFVENTRKRLCRLRVFFRCAPCQILAGNGQNLTHAAAKKTDFILFAALSCELCETGFL